MQINDVVSWTANKRSGSLKHRAYGKVIEIDLDNDRVRVEMRVGPGGKMKNRFYKAIPEVRIEEDAQRKTQRQG